MMYIWSENIIIIDLNQDSHFYIKVPFYENFIAQTFFLQSAPLHQKHQIINKEGQGNQCRTPGVKF